VNGLPAGVAAQINIAGATKQTVTTAGPVTAPAGNYEVTADIVAGAADKVVRLAYTATVDVASFCLSQGATQNIVVTYAPIPTSGNLWTTNDSSDSQVLGYASASLAATATESASIKATGSLRRAIAFDKTGNMWTLGDDVSEAINRFPASQFGTSGAKTADVKLSLDPGCVPGLSQLAFQPSDGSLWVSSQCAKTVSHIAATALAASGAATPDVVLGGMGGPEDVAFDKAGNMWVADSVNKTVLRYDAARLTASSNDAASLVITPKTAAQGDMAPNHLAFDKSGNLWVSAFAGNLVYELTAADQSGTGPKSLTPSVILTMPVDELLEGLAFDESGSLWLTLSAKKIGRLSTGLLVTNPNALPDVIVTSDDIGNAASLAFFPSPAGLPIYSSLP
jgi:sugar lactone lactonase YvrE